jgi:hypothetical protein
MKTTGKFILPGGEHRRKSVCKTFKSVPGLRFFSPLVMGMREFPGFSSSEILSTTDVTKWVEAEVARKLYMA